MLMHCSGGMTWKCDRLFRRRHCHVQGVGQRKAFAERAQFRPLSGVGIRGLFGQRACGIGQRGQAVAVQHSGAQEK